ncbi:MAG: 1-acyl-sn-glycerol-3-phosphate acyltransferase [Candidatus Latescibacteria bacterium]|nr:1-acyl-sn-glycerol-3-phosphate acyltransferase [Candidatus Latescibacterota bacterium]
MSILRAVFVAIAIVFLTILFGVPAILLAPFKPSGHLTHWITRWWARTLLRVGGVTVRPHGLEHVPAGRPCVLVANHASAADIPILLAHLPFQFRMIAKASLFHIPILGWYIRLAGYVSIDRESPTRAMRSLERAVQKVRSGLPVLVFPEGTRSRTGDLQPFNKGAFLLAIQAGVPVVPIAIVGSYEILVRGSLRVHGGTVDLIVAPPIDTQGYTPKARGQLADAAYDTIHRCLTDGKT